MRAEFRTALVAGAVFAACCTGLLAAETPRAPPAAPQQVMASAEAPWGSEATPASVIDDQRVLAVLGEEVHGMKGENLGRIVDVIVTHSGQVRAAVVDFGGFLGVGTRKIAVDWNALHFRPSAKADRIAADLTRNRLRLAPEYKQGGPVVVLGVSDVMQSMAGTPPEASEK